MTKNNRSAFTLAEMMVVMLILTILLAAFAPLMTKKSKVDLSSPWRWASNNSDIYYGIGANQSAMLGLSNKIAENPIAHMLINSDNRPAISLVRNKESVSLYFADGQGLCFGGNASNNPYCGPKSVSYGYNALSASSSDKSATGNTAIGHETLTSNTDGRDNTAVGIGSLFKNTSGDQNVGIGVGALASNTSGYYNVATGAYALKKNEESCLNSAYGIYALSETKGAKCDAPEKAIISTGSYNSAFGARAMKENTTGYVNSAFGYNALRMNKEGSANVAVGYLALAYTTGNSNVGIGSEACKYARGSNKICIGAGSGPANGSTEGGDKDTSYITYIGSTDTQVVLIPGQILSNNPIRALSDKRVKNLGKESTLGLEQIKQLKVYNFTFKNDDKKTPHIGIVAQDLQKLVPDAVSKSNSKYLHVNSEYITYSMFNAIKQLDKMLQDVIVQVKTIAAQVAEHDKQIKALQKENKELKDKVNNLEKRLNALEKKL